MGQILLQIVILLSGNYGFFNLLTLCLCIPMIDDEMLPRFITKYWFTNTNNKSSQVFESEFKPLFGIIRLSYLSIAWFFFSITAYGHFARDLKGNQPSPMINLNAHWTETYINMLQPTRCFNSYGLFV